MEKCESYFPPSLLTFLCHCAIYVRNLRSGSENGVSLPLPPSLPPSLPPHLLMPLRNGREEFSFRVREGPSDRGEKEDHVSPGDDAVGELRGGGREGGREGGGKCKKKGMMTPVIRGHTHAETSL
jgi:hypothetical protein